MPRVIRAMTRPAGPPCPRTGVPLRTIPGLAPELDHVVNAFDPWARDRREYYSLEWKPRRGAGSDAAFKKAR